MKYTRAIKNAHMFYRIKNLVLRKFKIDKSIAYLALSKIIAMVLGLLVTIFVAKKFTPDMQGYYYTFNSVLALKIFFELGLSVVIISFVSHEWASVNIDRDGSLGGSIKSINKLSEIGGFANKWFRNAGLLALMLLLVCGIFFFSAQKSSEVVDWFWQWITLSILTAICIALTPVWAILEGCNQTIEVYKVRLVQALVSGLIVFASISLNCELWVVVVSPLVELISCLYLMRFKYKKLLNNILYSKIPNEIGSIWRYEILPMQWRISLSWIGGYLTFSIFTPILFHYHGPIIAGQMGMSWMFLGALTSLSSSWVNPKLPIFGAYISTKNWAALDIEFWITVKRVAIVSLMIGAGMFSFLCVMDYFDFSYSKRLLDIKTAGIFIFTTIVLCVSLPFSTYLRAHKQEPLLKISLIGGILNVFLVWYLTIDYSAYGAAIAYMMVTLLQMPFIFITWYQKRIEWHK
jgi:O-antigen/teichoic acid export membrane protein